jgi:hypothetical protein
MSDLPKDAKQPTGFTKFGLDAPGDNVFFGFELRGGGTTTFTISHGGLTGIIFYLQRIADEAQKRRLSLAPSSADKEARSPSNNPILTIDFEPDTEGQNAFVTGTTATGAPLSPIQLSFDLIEKLHAHLPSLIDTMRTRQSAGWV